MEKKDEQKNTTQQNSQQTSQQTQQVQTQAVPKHELSYQKRLALKRVEELTKNSEWNLIQQIAHDIEAFYVIKNDKKPSAEKTLELIKNEIEARYSSDTVEEKEIKSILLDGLPSKITFTKWRSQKNWDEAVWARARTGSIGLFSPDKRATVIHSLYSSAVTGNTSAAKIWLTLSGDYVEKAETKNEIVDQFREINQILHGSKTKS